MKKISVEKGQSIVLMMVVVVGLMAIAALGLDGGTILNQRRQAQLAADNAAISAAYAVIENKDYTVAARTIAAKNGFTHNGTDPNVEVYRPPATGQYAGNSEYLQVKITTTSKPIFAQFAFQGKLVTTVEAVVRVVPPRGINAGNILFSTNPNMCEALSFEGSSDIYIRDGGIASNSDGSAKSNDCYSAEMAGKKLEITNGGISVHGVWNTKKGIATYDFLNQYSPLIPVPNIPVPACGSQNGSKVGNTYSPGWYNSGIDTPNGNVTFLPGIYCLKGNLKINGGTIATGEGVMFYMQSGEVRINGGANTRLTAPTNLVDANGTQWGGMLIYMPPSNTQGITINGNAGNLFSGTILAYGSGSAPKCSISGNSDTAAFYTQVICDTIKVTGDATTTFRYVEGLNFKLTTMIELIQ